MNIKMSPEEFYRALYKIIGSATPISADCGRLCNNACCEVTDEITGMYLFPHENVMYENMPIWGELYDTDFTYGEGKEVELFTCTGKCDRAMRPLSCRIFPLVPYAHEGEEMKIIMDKRGRGMCPLIDAIKTEELSEEFVKRVSCAMKLCMCNRETREFIYALTESIDEIGGLL